MLFGRPRVTGTHIGVDFVLELLASGWCLQRILDEYPRLKPEDLQAVFAYARDQLRAPASRRQPRPGPAVPSTDCHDRIACNPDILAGKPTVEGGRLSVELILGWLAQGWTHEMLIEAYPQLGRDDILAALAFAAGKMRESRNSPGGTRLDARSDQNGNPT